jgi:hypothetical protein
MRFLEERAESLVLLDDSTVKVVKKDSYSVVKYRMFSGLTIRYIARSGARTIKVEEEAEGTAFLGELDGRRLRIGDIASVTQAIIEHAATGSADSLLRLWQWHALLEDLRLTVHTNAGAINLSREGVFSVPLAVRVDVLERARYHDGSNVAKLLFTIREKNDALFRAFRNHSYAVALIGRDETFQVWLHFLPPEFKDRSIADCEKWLCGFNSGDDVRIMF